MMELKEAIQHLQESLADPTHKWGCEECKAEHVQLLRWLEDYKRLQDVSSWIPCSERLPNNAERCIVFMSDGNIQFGWWNAQYYDGVHDGGVWCVLYPGKPAKLFLIKNVPYWMPLPSLPKGGTK